MFVELFPIDCTLHRGGIWHFHVQWIYYSRNTKSTRWKTGKFQLFALQQSWNNCLSNIVKSMKTLMFTTKLLDILGQGFSIVYFYISLEYTICISIKRCEKEVL